MLSLTGELLPPQHDDDEAPDLSGPDSERALSLTEAAERLGWSRRTLVRALERHGIQTIGTHRPCASRSRRPGAAPRAKISLTGASIDPGLPATNPTPPFEWVPERHIPHWEPVWEAEPGVIAWDGLLLDGWRPLAR
jgi:regulatory Fis family protein